MKTFLVNLKIRSERRFIIRAPDVETAGLYACGFFEHPISAKEGIPLNALPVNHPDYMELDFDPPDDEIVEVTVTRYKSD